MSNHTKFNFNKLIRDKLPSRMREEGVVVYSRMLSADEYLAKLKEKLIEEASEVLEADSAEQLKVELADILEVIHAIAAANNLSLEEIELARLEKQSHNGKFAPDCFVDYIEVSSDNKKVIDYLRDKNRYYVFEDNKSV